MKKKVIAFLLLIFSFVLPLLGKENYNILLLHSYRPNYSWTSRIEQGIKDVFTQDQSHIINLKIEYMDILGGDNEDQFSLLADIYRFKYKPEQFDSIIISDNYAFNFMAAYGKEIWGNIPIVFCGIGGYSSEMASRLPDSTGVLENVDVDNTLIALFSMMPDVENILLWSIEHTNTDRFRKRAVEVINDFNPDISIYHGRDLSLEDAADKFTFLSENDAVILMSVLRDENRNIIPSDITIQTITEFIRAPVFCFHDIFLGHGAVGGKLVSGYEQGRFAALYSLKLMNGQTMDTLPVITESPNMYLFDDLVLEKYNLSIKNINDEIRIINPRKSFFQKNRTQVIVSIIFFCTFLLLVFFLIARGFIRERKKERHLKDQQILMFEISQDMLCIANYEGKFIQLNQAWEKTLGWSDDELQSRRFIEFVHPDDHEKTAKTMDFMISDSPVSGFENRYLCKNGKYIWLSWDAYPSRENGSIFAIARDITQKKGEEEMLVHQASYDDLTGIYNRRALFLISDKAFNRHHKNDLPLGVLMMDIDHFKKVNDTYGHAMGDLVLRQLITQSKQSLRDHDIIGRYGGEEFLVILQESDIEITRRVAERIRSRIEKYQFILEKTKISITISIGLSMLRKQDSGIEDTVKRADIALYKAKNRGRNRVETELE